MTRRSRMTTATITTTIAADKIGIIIKNEKPMRYIRTGFILFIFSALSLCSQIGL